MLQNLRKKLAQWIYPIERDKKAVTAVEYLDACFNKDYIKLYEIFTNVEAPTVELYAFGRVMIDKWIADKHPALLEVTLGTPYNHALMLKEIKELT